MLIMPAIKGNPAFFISLTQETVLPQFGKQINYSSIQRAMAPSSVF
jgi:hypothetical protein